MLHYYDIIFPIYLENCLTYSASDDIFAPGDYVLAEIGQRTMPGVVWSYSDKKQVLNKGYKIKPLLKKLDLPAMPADLRLFIDWASRYILTPIGMVLRQTMTIRKVFTDPPLTSYYSISVNRPRRLTKKRASIIEVLQQNQPISRAELIKNHGISGSILQKMVTEGSLEHKLLPSVRYNHSPLQEGVFDFSLPVLSPEQQIAADQCIAALARGKFHPFLLDGITGSGKTEVYLQSIAHCLNLGLCTLVLVPEISLTPQLVERFIKHFKITPIVWHSSISGSKRYRYWQEINYGRARIILGARSALFLPFQKLGLIVVDEEHDPSYKQEQLFIYNARDMAIKRAEICNIPIILASATVSIESHYNAEKKRYTRLRLRSRYAKAQLPHIDIIDMRLKKSVDKGRFISKKLDEQLELQKQKGEQTLLFLNRRGYAPLLICSRCGFHFECDNCDSYLVIHKKTGKLHCHYCHASMGYPDYCPQCNEGDCLIACGPGVEAIAEEVKRYHPKLRSIVVSSDYNKDLVSAFAAIRKREIDLIIGTQLVAKGHNFPMLTLVGVIAGDMSFDAGDLKSSERCYQLLSQVAGRAGRADKPGRALIQSWYPDDNIIMQSLKKGDTQAYYLHELDFRKKARLPPFSRLAAIIVSAVKAELALACATQLIRSTPLQAKGLEIYGPAKAPLFRLRNRYRYRILLRSYKSWQLQKTIRYMLDKTNSSHSKSVHIAVDIDPLSFH